MLNRACRRPQRVRSITLGGQPAAHPTWPLHVRLRGPHRKEVARVRVASGHAAFCEATVESMSLASILPRQCRQSSEAARRRGRKGCRLSLRAVVIGSRPLSTTQDVPPGPKTPPTGCETWDPWSEWADAVCVGAGSIVLRCHLGSAFRDAEVSRLVRCCVSGFVWARSLLFATSHIWRAVSADCL